jgi:hypothetical protein
MTSEGAVETMRADNEEYHDLIDDLTDRRFFGEVTLYFQGGNIESSRKSERNTKTEIRDQMQAKRRRKLTPRVSGGVSNG